MKNFLTIMLLFFASCSNNEQYKQELQNQKNDLAKLYLADSVLTAKISVLEKHAKLQDSVIKVLALHASYADSVTVQKQFKSERAERRGRFLGGLLKGLIPVLSGMGN